MFEKPVQQWLFDPTPFIEPSKWKVRSPTPRFNHKSKSKFVKPKTKSK